jgi:hypothetical protein
VVLTWASIGWAQVMALLERVCQTCSRCHGKKNLNFFFVLVLYIRKCLQSRAFLKWAPFDSTLASDYFGNALLLKRYPTLSSIGLDSKNATTSLPIKLKWTLLQIYLWRKVVGLFCFPCWDLPNHDRKPSTLVLLKSPWWVRGALRWFHNVSTYGEIIGYWTIFSLKIH